MFAYDVGLFQFINIVISTKIAYPILASNRNPSNTLTLKSHENEELTTLKRVILVLMD